MKRIFAIFTIIFLLSSCSPETIATTQSNSAPQATDPVVPPPTPAPTLPPAVLTVDQKVDAYMKGEIDDIGDLSTEKLQQFSESLVEKLSALRGASPNIYNNEAYLAPDTLTMRQVEDGTNAEQKTIEMFVPISKDAEGNLMVKGPDGEWVTVTNSANFDWNMVITDSTDPRIELPTHEDRGMNVTARNLDHVNPNTGGDDYALVPMLVYDKNLGEIFFEGANGRGSQQFNVLTLVKIETDQVSHPVYAKIVLGIQGTSRIYTEGSANFVGSAGEIREGFSFWNALQTDQIYYFMAHVDQQDMADHKFFISLDNWTGFVPMPTAFDVLAGTNSNNKDLLLISFFDMIAKK
jgi:hypothetical protein